MVSSLGLWISRVFRAFIPDPYVIAIVLLALTIALALAFGTFPSLPEGSRGLGDRVASLLDTMRGTEGLWKLLAFSMQMCLVLVTGHALASSKPVGRAIRALADKPRSGRQAAFLVGLVTCGTSALNWGLGLIVGALLAREMGRSLAHRGIPHHYPLLAAAGYTGLMVWHGGLSGSAPLSMTTAEGASRVLPRQVIERLAGEGGAGVPLSETLFAPFNLVITLGLLVVVPVVLAMLSPARAEDMIAPPRHITNLPATNSSDVPAASGAQPSEHETLPDRLDRSPLFSGALALLLLGLVARFLLKAGPLRTGLDEVNAVMMAAGLLLHGSCRSYLAAVEDAARGCAGILLQFPIYAAVMAIMAGSGLIKVFAEHLVVGGPREIPVLTFFAACVVNLFVPSGGGQWAVQGPVALESALAHDIPLGKMVMAVAYGDQLTNMLQPFWALPLLAITGVKARDIVGYTAICMLAGGVWIALWMWLM